MGLLILRQYWLKSKSSFILTCIDSYEINIGWGW